MKRDLSSGWQVASWITAALSAWVLLAGWLAELLGQMGPRAIAVVVALGSVLIASIATLVWGRTEERRHDRRKEWRQ